MPVNQSKISDFELIQNAIQGQQYSFSEIVRRYQPLIATTAMGMLGDLDQAQEIGQQVFIRFYKSMNNFRNEAKLSTYLTRITINLCLNHLKRNQNFRNRKLDLVLATNSASSDNFDKDFEEKELINQALQYLSENQRIVIVLRMIQGYSTQETAELLGIPKGTVLSRLKRAMDNLKDILTKHYKYER